MIVQHNAVKPKTLHLSYSQNFFKSPEKLLQLINTKTNIKADEQVVDIGAGRGIIARSFSQLGNKVTAFELDAKLASALQQENIPNVKIFNLDFREVDLVRLGKYKVFANIPFFLTADIIRKLFLESNNPPLSAYLFLEKDAALRFMGAPARKESLQSLLLKPFWDIKIIHIFRPRDFVPAPKAEVVLVSFLPRRKQELAPADKFMFTDFLSFLLNERKAQLKNALLKLFSFQQLKLMGQKLQQDWHKPAGSYPAQVWLSLFKSFKMYCSPEKQSLINGSYARLQRHQMKLNQIKITP